MLDHERLADARRQRGGGEAAVFGGEGVLPGTYFNDVFSYKHDQQLWAPIRPRGDGASGQVVPSPRMGHSASLVGDAVLVFGGYLTELHGDRHHRVATNELWALALKGGLASRTSASP